MTCLPFVAYGTAQTKQPSVRDNRNATIDARIFLKDRPQNKQDERGNTFLHELALRCHKFDEWEQMGQEMEQFVDEHEKNMTNPLIENNDHATARKLAKHQFNTFGNPICGTFIVFLREAEFLFLNRCSSQEGRKNLSGKE